MKKSKRSGMIQLAVSCLLLEKPMHGYQIMKELAERSGDIYTPSAGTIYPMLQMLQHHGYVNVTETDGKNVFELNAAGKEHTLKRMQELNYEDFWLEWRHVLEWKQSKEARLLKDELMLLKGQIRQAEKFVRNQPEQTEVLVSMLKQFHKELSDFQKRD
ncbi:MAG: PadR family transcriptional regulator [Bacillus sp. (in: firmicutes)]